MVNTKSPKKTEVKKHAYNDGVLFELQYDQASDYPWGSLKIFDGYKNVELDISAVGAASKTSIAMLKSLESMVQELRLFVEKAQNVKVK